MRQKPLRLNYDKDKDQGPRKYDQNRHGLELEVDGYKKGEEYFKDEVFDENTYTDACFREFRNLNQGVIDDYIKEQSKLVDKSHTGYILIPAFQSQTFRVLLSLRSMTALEILQDISG